MADDESLQQYEEDMATLEKAQEEEMKKKCNPLFAKLHGMSDEEMEELRDELQKVHDLQKLDLARKYGVKLEK